MALYVAICLLAALTVASHAELEHRDTLVKIIWGTTLGLALAHWFAFRLSARLVAGGRVRQTDAEIGLAQLAGSVAVAVLATVPIVLFDGESEVDATRWFVAGLIAFVGYYVALSSGASTMRALVYASLTTVVALVIVVVKNALSGH